MTIAGLMVITAFVAVELWLLRESTVRELSLHMVLAMVVCYIVLVAPLIIKGWYRHVAEPRFEPIDPRSEQVPLRVEESITETVPELEALGFRSLGHFRSERSVPNVASFVSLFDHPRERRTAQLFTVFGASGPIRKVSTVLAFKTEFTDGTWLITGNDQIPSVFPPSQRREGSMSFPWVTHPARLYEIHRASVAHYASDGIPAETDIQDPIEFLRSTSQRELARFAEVGYYRLDEARQVYRLTWKGAYLMTWKLMWPINRIRQMLRRRKAARMLSELGLGGPMFNEPRYDRAPMAP
jgi:hypothetical protein